MTDPNYKIVQLTDIHLTEPGKLAEGIDSVGNFLKTLNHAMKESPDHIVITGDICLWDGELSVYEWVRDYMEEGGVPYTVIPGNHDRPDLVSEVFFKYNHTWLRKNKCDLTRVFNGETILFLDSSDSILDDYQLKLILELSEEQERVVVFTHYPPDLMGSLFMDDNFPLKNHEQIIQELKKSETPISFFSGHYHWGTTKQNDNIGIYVTPSTWIQIDPEEKDFKVLSDKPSYRIITLDTKIKTRLITL